MRVRLIGLALVMTGLLTGCPQERQATGGGGGEAAPDAAVMHSRHYRDDLGEAFLAASRAHEALLSGDPVAARRHGEEVRERLAAGKERAWLAEQRTLLRLEDQAILLQSDLGTAHPDALRRSKQLMDALSAAQVDAASVRPPAQRTTNAVRPGLGDAGALALRAHDYLSRGEQAQALGEVKALRRRLKEARQYAAGEQLKRLAVLDVEANQLEYMVSQNSPKALRASRIMARHLGMSPRLASQGGGGGGGGRPVVVGDPQYYPDPGARRGWTGDGSRRNGWAED